MSNTKSKSQQPQQLPQQQQQQQQTNGQSLSQVNKQSDPIPPQYQPPPQPSGILKNNPHFNTNIGGLSTNLINQNLVISSNLNNQLQSGQIRGNTVKDVQGKLSPKIEHFPTASKNPTIHASSYYPPKLQQGQFLAPHSQYPPASVGPILQQTPRTRLSDEEFLRLGPVEMLKFVRKTESDIARIAAEQNRQIQNLMTELRVLKEANQRLSDDNQELRDLCCFLDDDRQKGRKLAREWQRFGRYTASVMRQEVSAYQNKLRQLDNKQQELIKDNLELKELCLYLDEERGGGQRDDGDGSSSSTNAEETLLPSRTRNSAATFNDQTMQYVRSLEQRVKQLEEDKSILQARAQTRSSQGQIAQQNPTIPAPPPLDPNWETPATPSHNQTLDGRPEAVVRALQVLEVREQLEREAGHDGEKALIREMCNVVWRKLEEGPQAKR